VIPETATYDSTDETSKNKIDILMIEFTNFHPFLKIEFYMNNYFI